MSEEMNLVDGLEMAIECIRDLSPCHEGDEWDDSEEAAAISGIRAAQHHVADLAQRVADLEAERDALQHEHHAVRADAQARVDAAVIRALSAEKERDELRASENVCGAGAGCCAQAAEIERLLAALEKAREGLSCGLWDYGPGQSEHDQCDELIAEIDEILKGAK